MEKVRVDTGYMCLRETFLNDEQQALTVCYSVRVCVNVCVVAERPQHMLMRVSVGIHKEDIAAAIETYNLLSEKWFTHASPTLFNAGTNRPQLSRYTYNREKMDSHHSNWDKLISFQLFFVFFSSFYPICRTSFFFFFLLRSVCMYVILSVRSIYGYVIFLERLVYSTLSGLNDSGKLSNCKVELQFSIHCRTFKTWWSVTTWDTVRSKSIWTITISCNFA